MSDLKIENIANIESHADKAWCVSWSPNGTILASCGGDKKVKLWFEKDNCWTCIKILDSSHKRTIRRVAWSPCGNFLASCSFDATTCIWDVTAIKNASILWNKQNKKKFLIDSEHNVFIDTSINTSLEQSKDVIKQDSIPNPNSNDSESNKTGTNIIFENKNLSPNKEKEVSKKTQNIEYKNLKSEEISISKSVEDMLCVVECIATLEGHENEIKSVAWSNSGSLLATCSRDKSVWIWEVDSDGSEFECLGVLNDHTQDVKNVVWLPYHEILASVSYDNTIKFHSNDDDDWSCIASLDSHESTVWSLDFNENGHKMVTCSDDRTIKIWKCKDLDHINNNSWKCVCTLSGYHSRPIYDVSWCKYSNLIASACGDNTIRIFRQKNQEADSGINSENNDIFESYELVSTIHTAHEQDVNCVVWNPKIRGLLASAGDDGKIKLWKVIPEN